MKRGITILVAVIMVGMYSCKKDSKGGTLSGKVKSRQENYGPVSYFGYDSEGRLSFIASMGDTDRYVYETNKVTLTQMSGNIIIYTLNANGLATNNTADESYTYNSDGNMTSINYNAAAIQMYEYNNGNLVRLNNGTNYTDTIEYYGELENRGYMAWKDVSFLGKPSKNLLKRVKDIVSGVEKFNCQYEFDASSRVSKVTETANSITYVTLYTYY